MLIYVYDGHMQKVLSSGDKFDFYSHIYKGGGLSYFLLTMSNLNDCLF